MTLGPAAFAAVIALGLASAATAQTAGGRFEISGGAAWIGGVSMSSIDATETQASGATRALFGFSRELTSSPAIEARVAVAISARVDVEATGSYARPQLSVTTANDVEGAAAVTAGEQLQEFTVGGAASWFLVHREPQTRTMPFVTGGLAYARQIHEGDILAQAGEVVEVGGGVKRTFSVRDGRVKSIGLRFDARARVRSRALAVDDRSHVSAIVGASLFVRF